MVSILQFRLCRPILVLLGVPFICKVLLCKINYDCVNRTKPIKRKRCSSLIPDSNKCFLHIMQDPNSIIFTADLHIKFPANVFDVVRKVNVNTVI